MQENNRPLHLDKETAQKKAESFCAYQERSHHEVRQKLQEWGVYASDAENIICDLIAENFLNEERFAFAYAHGKFSIKSWGKIKIKQGLKLKRVPEVLIKKALNQLDDEAYEAKLCQVLQKKRRELKDKEVYLLKNKLARYALGRGFERDLIFYLLDNKELNIL